MPPPPPFQTALAAIDAAHAEDPNTITVDGVQLPYELHYARKMSHYLALRCPADDSMIGTADSPAPAFASGSASAAGLASRSAVVSASESAPVSASASTSASPVLQLAIRAQHLRRWEVPRAAYPPTKPGYLTWRAHLKNRQADLATSICLAAGLDASTSDRVGALVRKEDLRRDEETMVLEDVACLVFLDDQFGEFERGHEEEKILGILRKTWAKMSEEGRRLALEMDMEGRSRELVEKALAG